MKSYDKLLVESALFILEDFWDPAKRINSPVTDAIGSTPPSTMIQRARGMGGRAGNWMKAHKLRTAAGVGLGIYAVAKIKKTRCRKKCAALPDVAARQNCMASC
jgi:hypothetical protein